MQEGETVNVLKLFPLGDHFMGSVDFDSKSSNAKSNLQTIVILDKSGSMGNNVKKMINEVLPKFFKNLAYEPKQLLNLILFDDKAALFRMWVHELTTTRKKCGGVTMMAPAIHELKKLFETFDSDVPVRLLTLSDGEVFDPQEVEIAGAKLAKVLLKSNFTVNSQAVRLFTSNSQPDTTALCSVLRFNNLTRSSLVDISAHLSSDLIAEQMAELFISDGLSSAVNLTADSNVFMKLPWEDETTTSLSISKENNLFWLNAIPGSVKIGDKPVEIAMQEPLTLAKFHALLEKKLLFIVDYLKVLKVVGSDEANGIIRRAFAYIEEKEIFLADKLACEGLLDPKKLRDRVRILMKASAKQKKITNILATIANDNKVRQLNSAQKADYLRETVVTKASRGLARRAAKEGFDFDEIAQKEVAAMAKHFHEIEGIDDSALSVSFFSQDTTLGGIKALVDIVKEGSVEFFDVNDILQLLNIVGVACSGPIGDFPDPMTWRLNEIFLGCYISLSDILVAFNQSKGETLLVPAIGKEITNVIPIFDDPRIGNFLRKYAPSLLEYTFSVGMRRMIAEVPMTIGYTIASGIIKMVQELNENKSTLHVEVFEQLVTTFDSFVGRYFDHITPLLKETENAKTSFYLAGNGVSNLISPIYRMFRESNHERIKLIPDILRTLFSHEVWQIIRRAYKGKEDCEAIARSMLNKLIGIDFEKHKTSTKELFEKEPLLSDIKFYDQPAINSVHLTELCDKINQVEYLALMPKYLEAVAQKKSEMIKNMPPVTGQVVLDTLNIDYSYKLFLFLNIFQALYYTTSASRIDLNKEVMKIVDLKDQKRAKKTIRQYIRRQFESLYLSDLAAKQKQEQEIMGEVLVDTILSSITYDDLVTAWRHGVERNEVTYKIKNSSSTGFNSLCSKLSDSSVEVPLRKSVFKILLLGVDEEFQPVWNNGGVCFLPDMKQFRNEFLMFFSESDWNEIMREYKARQRHIYREKTNRHGHGNGKPSFWAMGYKSIKEFQDSVTKNEFEKYCEEHLTCCGVHHML